MAILKPKDSPSPVVPDTASADVMAAAQNLSTQDITEEISSAGLSYYILCILTCFRSIYIFTRYFSLSSSLYAISFPIFTFCSMLVSMLEAQVQVKERWHGSMNGEEGAEALAQL